jgi:uncharacterized membrane protein
MADMAAIGKIEAMTGMPGYERFRIILRWVLAAFYMFAGIVHVAWPAPFLTITPDWVPKPELVIFLTGVCEIAGAIGLLNPAVRRMAGIGLALYAVAVFPANIKHAMIDMASSHPSLGLWYHIPRFALQPVLVWAALFSSTVITWPFRQVRADP